MGCQQQGCKSRKTAKLRANGLTLCDKCEQERSENAQGKDSESPDADPQDSRPKISHAQTKDRDSTDADSHDPRPMISHVRIVINELLSYCANYHHTSTRKDTLGKLWK